MPLTRTLLLCTTMLPVLCAAQSFGLLAGIERQDLYAAGKRFAPGNGLSLGCFMPFWLQDRWVLRVEAGVSFQRLDINEEENLSYYTRVSAHTAVLGRFYANIPFCFSIGGELSQDLTAPPLLRIDRQAVQPARTDVALLGGLAYRFNEQCELGVRYAQGILNTLDAGDYGMAHSRRFTILFSYLLHYRKPNFLQQRSRYAQPGAGKRY